MIATIKSVGAKTRKAVALIGSPIREPARKSAKNNTIKQARPPDTVANNKDALKIFFAFLYCPLLTLAATILDTAKGRL